MPPTHRVKRLLRLSIVPIAAVVALGLVVVSSYSVFTAQTGSPGNAWSTGTVLLSNDSTAFGTPAATGSALFTVSDVRPGGPAVTRCLTLTYTGSLQAVVKLRAGAYSDPDGLLQYLDITRSSGSGATDASCTSYSSGFNWPSPETLDTFRQRTTYAIALDLGWLAPGGTSSKQVRITITPRASMPDSVQGKSASLEFVFEAQNT